VAAVLWRRPQIVFLVTAGVAAADLLATGLKLLIARPRPYVQNPEPPPLLLTPLDLSLPSGHAATSFAGATLLMWCLPGRLAPGLYVLATLVAFSRVYVGVHYPGDVVLGAALGIAVARALRLLVRARRRSPRAPPPG
jgi:undecaprenyl-diphosphatase